MSLPEKIVGIIFGVLVLLGYIIVAIKKKDNQ